MKQLAKITLLSFAAIVLFVIYGSSRQTCKPFLPNGLGWHATNNINNFVGDNEWILKEATTQYNQGMSGFLDDDPIHGISVIFQIDSHGGDGKVYKWQSWQYGLVVCPFVIPGDGSPGTFMELNRE